MSGISLNRFLEIAGRKTDGEVRIAVNTEDELINKGELGHKLAAVLRFGDQATRDSRNASAVQKFRAALTDRFGIDIARKALEEAGYQDGTPLTGRLILEANEHAHQMTRDNRLDFDTLVENAKLEDVDDEVAEAFRKRFTENLEAKTRFGEQKLPPEEIELLKERTERQVRALAKSGTLQDAELAREALSDAMQGVLVAIANRAPPDILLSKLLAAQERYQALAALESVRDEDNETDNDGNSNEDSVLGALRMQVATNQALKALNQASPDSFMEDVLRRGLSSSSSLRALYAGADVISKDPTSSLAQRREALALQSQCAALVGIIDIAWHPLTSSSEGDVSLLGEVDKVDKKQKTAAKTALAAVFEKWKGQSFERQTGTIGDFIGAYNDSQDKVDGRFPWDQSEFSRRLEKHVHGLARRMDIPPERAIRDYRAHVEGDDTLHPDLKDKLLRTLDGMEAEHQLFIDLNRAFHPRRIMPESVWRLVVPGKDQGPSVGKWDMEQTVRGSYASMCRGLSEVIRQQRDGVKLNGTTLGKLHEIALKDNIRGNDDVPMTTGFRSGTVQTELHSDLDLTPQGAAEIRIAMERDKDSWYVGSNGNDNVIILSGGTNDDVECRKRADDILANFSREVGRTTNRLKLVADTIQALYRSQLFTNGASRSVVTLMTNRLLMEIGEPPTILQDPTLAMGCSSTEFMVAIRRGQRQARAFLT